MLPLKPYLLRAARDWALDNDLTPLIMVDAMYPGARVPAEYVEDGRIVLNIHPRAVQFFDFDDDWLRFSARFEAKSLGVEIPVASVKAIYTRENGQGVSFPETDAEQAKSESPAHKAPSLRVVK